ncbi:hypothetical protein ACFUIW_11210 [Streptomyces sp. NPDC057245]|uniref:hypothetical protein n=1 Tax=Streptomyces sp. NPDC057245 TaxID=3346065 RepID=UPI0036450E27
MFSGPGTIRRRRHLLLAVAAGALLTACGGDPEPAAHPAPRPASPTQASASATPPSSAPASSEPPTTSPVEQDVQDAFDAAMKAHPGAAPATCTENAPLDDADCGAALRAAEKAAADTERRLRRKDPENADLLYGAALTTAGAVQDGMARLRDPIPCYGLSDAPQPPPPLLAEAESICAEAAGLTWSEWGIFLTAVEP